MLKRFFSSIFILLLLSSCARYKEAPEATYIVQPRPMTSFNQVEVNGAINVNLHTGYKTPQVIMHGDPRDLLKVKTVVVGNRLVIDQDGPPRYGEVSADIRGRYLNSFEYDGGGTIKGTNIHSGLLDVSITNDGQTTLGGSIVLRKLKVGGGGLFRISGVKSQYVDISMDGKPKLQIVGVIRLSKLNLDGGGKLSMYWVKSNLLTVCARGHTFIELGGTVDKLDVELWGSARFNGRYLRSKRAFVRTHDKSVADLLATKHQHTLATDASDIYFYEIPAMRADFMAFQGSVLDMRDLSLPYIKEYDRYNKYSQ